MDDDSTALESGFRTTLMEHLKSHVGILTDDAVIIDHGQNTLHIDFPAAVPFDTIFEIMGSLRNLGFCRRLLNQTVNRIKDSSAYEGDLDERITRRIAGVCTTREHKGETATLSIDRNQHFQLHFNGAIEPEKMAAFMANVEKSKAPKQEVPPLPAKSAAATPNSNPAKLAKDAAKNEVLPSENKVYHSFADLSPLQALLLDEERRLFEEEDAELNYKPALKGKSSVVFTKTKSFKVAELLMHWLMERSDESDHDVLIKELHFDGKSTLSKSETKEQQAAKQRLLGKILVKELKLGDQLTEEDGTQLLFGSAIPGPKLTDYLADVLNADLGVAKKKFINKCIALREPKNTLLKDAPLVPEITHIPTIAERKGEDFYPFVTTTSEQSIESPFYKLLVGSIRKWAETQASLLDEEDDNSVDLSKLSDDFLIEKFCEAFGRVMPYKDLTPLMLQGFVPLPPGLSRRDIVSQFADILIDSYGPDHQRLRKEFCKLGKEHFDGVKGVDLITANKFGKVDYGTALRVLIINKSLTQKQFAGIAGISEDSLTAHVRNDAAPKVQTLSLFANHLLAEGAYKEEYTRLLIELSKKEFEFLVKPEAELNFREVLRKVRFQTGFSQEDMARKMNILPQSYERLERGFRRDRPALASVATLQKIVTAWSSSDKIEDLPRMSTLLFNKRIEGIWEREGVNRPNETLKIHELMQKIRIQAGISTAEMAKEMGVNLSTVNGYESPIRRNMPSVENLNEYLDVCFRTGNVKDPEAMRTLAFDKREIAALDAALESNNLSMPNMVLALNQSLTRVRMQTGRSRKEMATAIGGGDVANAEYGMRPTSATLLVKILGFCKDELTTAIATRSPTFLTDSLELFYGMDRAELAKKPIEEIRAIYTKQLTDTIVQIEQQWVDEKLARDGVSKGNQNISENAIRQSLEKAKGQLGR